MNLCEKEISNFRETVYEHYKKHGRNEMLWRKTSDPYKILVSEIMLQQTQVDRVAKKYESFIAKFPDFQSLANTSLQDILTVWQGLGYNRRAIALQKCAEVVTMKYHGQLPSDAELLIELPGIGPYTAAAIRAFAFNVPAIVVETNIRTVFIHHFFRNRKKVSDDEMTPLIKQTSDDKNPRIWYWALMDYGTLLKEKFPNPSRKSAGYTKQSRFEGSDRQIRGMILKLLATKQCLQNEMFKLIGREKPRIRKCLGELEKEGFIVQKGSM